MPRPVPRLLLALLAVVALVPAAALAAGSRGHASLPGLLTTKGPWGPNNEASVLAARLGAIDLPALSAEGAALHIHQHLDLWVNGVRRVVPGGIGIARDNTFISELHTHDESGILHIEAPRIQPFTLGQLFDVWGVRLTRRCLGGNCEGRTTRLLVWVNGKLWKGDPRRIVLRQHDEYAMVFGTIKQVPKALPRSYDFPEGV
jgi:hypothetical protein